MARTWVLTAEGWVLQGSTPPPTTEPLGYGSKPYGHAGYGA